MDKVKTILNEKIKEHTGIIVQITKDIEVLLKKLETLKKDPNQRQELMVTSTTLLTLKDRAMFHKAAAMTLQDVLQEVDKLQ